MKKFFAVILSFSLMIAPMPVINSAHAAEEEKKENKGYATIVLGMANGIIGSTIITKCKLGMKQSSLMVYMAGSLVYVAAEIMGGMNKKKNIDKNAQSLDKTKNNMKEGGDYQKASVQAQIDNEKSNLEHTKKKNTWMKATLAVYAIATTLAAIEALLGWSGNSYAACFSSDQSHLTIQAGIAYAYVGANGYAAGGLMGAGLSVAMMAFLPKLMALLNVGTSVTNFAVTGLNSAIGRIAMFAAATLLVKMISDKLTEEEKAIEERIATLEKVRDQFEKSTNALAEGASEEVLNDGAIKADTTLAKNDIKKDYDLTKLAKDEALSKRCFSSTTKGLDYTNAGCRSPIKLSRPKIDSKFNIPTLDAGTKASIDMAQALANGENDRAEIEAGKLASLAGRLDSIRDDLMKKVNAKLIKEGKKPIDPNAELKRQVGAFEAELKKQKINPLAVFPQSGSAQTEEKVSSKETATPKGPEQGAITIGAQGNNDLMEGDESLSEGITEPIGDSTEESSEENLSESLENFEDSASEIASNPDESIFKMLSNRYLLNYEKLFKKKIVKEPIVTK